MFYDIGIVTRQNESQWGGDLKALYTIESGLKKLGYSVKLGQSAEDLTACNFVFLSNTCLDQVDNLRQVTSTSTPYGIIGFHEDFIGYFPESTGATYIVKNILDHGENRLLNIPRLKETPDIIKYFAHPPPRIQLMNYQVLQHAKLCVANSRFEERTIKRDCPSATTCAVPWTAGMADEWGQDIDDSFLELTGLEKDGYILQVGRLETRKNQLYTALGCKDLDIPIVFIATKGYQPWYEKILRDVCKKYCKDVYIVSEEYGTQKSGSVNVIQMPGGKRLSLNILLSAFGNAAVNVHPAFHELPGYTYLESLALGTPTLASNWTSIKDYLQYKGGSPDCKGLVEYCTPYDIGEIEEKTHSLMNLKRRKIPNNKIFKRTDVDVATDLIKELSQVWNLKGENII